MNVRFVISAIACLLLVIPLPCINAHAKTVEYTLTIAQQKVTIAAESAQGMTINGSIPGPVLRFKEGDLARIHVQNKMDVDTSIHWHGILVPPHMDGVPYVSFPPIQPGTTFTYEFPIRQSGTYWYHSHTRLQEQSGVYGSIVIEPRKQGTTSVRDHVILLSDWTDENPNSVLRTLKRGSEWYALEKGGAQSIFGAARLGMLGDYFKRELQRMPAMDISDVAYDYFLANGKPESTLPAKPNETVRLRIIDGSATTYFYLEFAGGPMTIIAADGLDVQPVRSKRFLIGVAETYDVLIHVPSNGAYEFRATAHDGSGYASVWVGSGKRHPASDIPKPNLYHAMGEVNLKNVFALTPAGAMGMPDRDVETGAFDAPGMTAMGSMRTGDMKDMDMKKEGSKMRMDPMGASQDQPAGYASHNMDMQMNHTAPAAETMKKNSHTLPDASHTKKTGKKYGTNFRFLAADVSSFKHLAMDGMNRNRPWPPYHNLRSVKPTAFPRDKPVRVIRLTLDGDMERYVWLLNNKPLSESDSIRIREGEVARFIMINRTMMHHPFHLHGHFFRVVNGQGNHAPLKHTVDVAPMSTTVIEFNANEFGDWFFHCHLLYHMKAGMARVVHYENYSPSREVAEVRSELYKDDWYFWSHADALSNMTEGFVTFSNTRNMLKAQWEIGWQHVERTEWETIFTYDRYFNRFFSLFAGADLMGDSHDLEDARAVFGLHYLLPLNIESRVWVDSDGGARFHLEKDFELTPRLSLLGEVEYDTHEKWEGSTGLSYMIHKNVSIKGQWHSHYGFGGGVEIMF